MLLETRAAVAPEPGSAFVIVDGDLIVHALSARAERLLGVYEIDAVARLLTDFLVPTGGSPQNHERVEEMIAGIAINDDRVRRFTMLRAGLDGPELQVRVGSCGPPRGALIVLEGAGRPRRHLELVRPE